MGISVYPFDGEDAEALLRNAAAAIYQANGQHKNGYHFYSASMNANSLVRVSLESDLRKAVKRKEFVVYYQPKVEAQTRKIVGAEAVVRWIHPLKGTLVQISHKRGRVDLVRFGLSKNRTRRTRP